MPDSQRPLLDQSALDECIDQLASQICAAHQDVRTLALVGLHRRGVPLAKRLAARMAACPGRTIQLGTIDITQYRDDLKSRTILPRLEGSDIPFDVDGAHIVLCDEVIYTGRTIRAAMDELLDHGRPARVQLAVLVERAGREFPIQPDYVGLHTDLPSDERVRVQFIEVDGTDQVYVQAANVP
jgi:pyrimidine operon attenuation protein / uracil phosphoribosyltransferase